MCLRVFFKDIPVQCSFNIPFNEGGNVQCPNRVNDKRVEKQRLAVIFNTWLHKT